MKTSIHYSLLVSLILCSASSFAATISSSNSDKSGAAKAWRPVSSEKLLSLPVNIVEKRLLQDFSLSAQGQQLSNIEAKIVATLATAKQIKSQIKNNSANYSVELRFQLLEKKSAYLDLLQSSQSIQADLVSSKQQVYEALLEGIRQQGRRDNVDNPRLIEAQNKARMRMKRNANKVEQLLFENDNHKPAFLETEYAGNLNKIEQLKTAIAKHKANLSPQLEGLDVSNEEFLRQLLLDAASEQAVLEQEKLMISYMAKLVALDAQSLEYEIAYVVEGKSVNSARQSRPATSVDLFTEEY